MTSNQFRLYQKARGYTDAEMAEWLNCTESLVRRIHNGMPVPESLERTIEVKTLIGYWCDAT